VQPRTARPTAAAIRCDEHEVSTGLQPLVEGFDGFLACFLVEVDEHVATEDGVDAADDDRARGVEQVELPELAQRAHRGLDRATVGVSTKWRSYSCGHRAEAAAAVHALARRMQHGRDMSLRSRARSSPSNSAERATRSRSCTLFAGRAAGAPDRSRLLAAAERMQRGSTSRSNARSLR